MNTDEMTVDFSEKPHAQKLKKNGGTACWLVLDDKKSEYHTAQIEALAEKPAIMNWGFQHENELYKEEQS